MSRTIGLSEWKLTTRAAEGREQWEDEQEERLMRLMAAVEKGDRDDVDHLIKDGVPLNLPLNEGITALGLAASKDDQLMLRHLLHRGASVTTSFAGGKDAAWAAMDSSAQKAFEILMNNGARPSQRLLDTRETRLIAATKLSNVAVVRVLVRMKMNINDRDKEGRTALHHNLAKNPYSADDLEICRILLAEGCDPNEEDLEGIPAHALAHNLEQKTVLEGHDLSLIAEAVMNKVNAPDPTLDDMDGPEPPAIPDLPVTPIRKPRRRL